MYSSEVAVEQLQQLAAVEAKGSAKKQASIIILYLHLNAIATENQTRLENSSDLHKYHIYQLHSHSADIPTSEIKLNSYFKEKNSHQHTLFPSEPFSFRYTFAESSTLTANL